MDKYFQSKKTSMFTQSNIIQLIIVAFLTMNSFAAEISTHFDKVLLAGEITVDDYLKFKDIIEKNKNINEIVVSSGGGNVLAGMAIGKLIKSRNFDVRVMGACGSSCANYIFVAGNKKILSRDALVFFHGGIQQEGLHEEVKVLKEISADKAHGVSFYDDGKGPPPDYILEAVGMKKANTLLEAVPLLAEVEKKYFADMQVNNDLPTYGQKGIYKQLWNSNKYQIFYYDLESMSKLGIKNIEVEGSQWHPEENPIYSNLYQVSYP